MFAPRHCGSRPGQLLRTGLVLLAAVLFAAACSSTATDTEPRTTAAPAVAPTEPAPTTTTAPPDPDRPITTSGPVTGSADGEVRRFQAIPYAAPPVGDLRFAPPQAPEPWTDDFAATTTGASCPQVGDVTAAFTTLPAESSEDCLTLDVVAPIDAADLPVMVWIHGGGLTSGSGHQPLYEGTNLANKGTVIVTINYRLGALGFLVTDGLSTEGGPIGNWGLQDQKLALEWVQNNIALFGGDPGNVTIFGESAGGFSVCALLALDDGPQNLFHRAIIQSGAGCGPFTSFAEATGEGTAFADATGCAGEADETACLRGLSVDDLLAQEQPNTFVADGTMLSQSALELAQSGELKPVPIITGFNRDEATLFNTDLTELSDAQLRDRYVEFAPEADVNVLAELYNVGFADNLQRFFAFSTDMTFACPAMEFADTASALTSVWTYHLTYVSDLTPGDLGATHGAELVYLFGNPAGIPVLGTSEIPPEDQTVADFFQNEWVAFARDGQPSPAWLSHSVIEPSVWEASDSPLLRPVGRDGRCAALAEAGAR